MVATFMTYQRGIYIDKWWHWCPGTFHYSGRDQGYKEYMAVHKVYHDIPQGSYSCKREFNKITLIPLPLLLAEKHFLKYRIGYCKLGNFREGFIYAKLRICEVSWK